MKVNLIKPVYHPSIYKDESPLGYLQRVAFHNGYENYRWLLKTSSLRQTQNLKRLITEILKSEWCEGYLQYNETKDILNLDSIYINSNFRFCPKCLIESGYWNCIWHLKASVACTKHKTWLVDRCPNCNAVIKTKNVRYNLCLCGHSYEKSKSSRPPKNVLRMQNYIENLCEDDFDNLQFGLSSSLPLDRKLKVLELISKVQPNNRVRHTGVSTLFNTMESAREVAIDTAEAFFDGKQGFFGFLKRIHSFGYGGRLTGEDLLTRFYRNLYKLGVEPCFDNYKHLIKQYINNHWTKPLSRRNCLFDPGTIEEHPWIPIRQACLEFNISKSKLHFATQEKLVEFKTSEKSKRIYTSIYRPDLLNRIHKLNDIVDSVEARTLLMTSKKQFQKLRENGVFEYTIPPSKNYSKWQFSK